MACGKVTGQFVTEWPIPCIKSCPIWVGIETGDLNSYGDEHGTTYKGGGPLVNPQSNQTITLYDYTYNKFHAKKKEEKMAFDQGHGLTFCMASFGIIVAGF